MYVQVGDLIKHFFLVQLKIERFKLHTMVTNTRECQLNYARPEIEDSNHIPHIICQLRYAYF